MAPLASLRAAAATASRMALTVVLVLACRSAPVDAPPAAEFLVAAGDSTFWVRSTAGEIRVRRAPLTLARVDGRFHELYVADDDRSFYDALLVAQRVYRRDLITGDSLVVFEETRVADVARAYAAANPDERPLGPNEEGSDDPHAVATSEAELLDTFGPFLTLEYRLDIDITNGEDSHVVRRTVVDLRSGRSVTLREAFGDSAASAVIASAWRAYRAVVDSVRRGGGRQGRRAARAIDAFPFDSTSYGIEQVDGQPAVAFFVPGTGPTGEGLVLPLPHVRVREPEWWSDVKRTVPRAGRDSLSEEWPGPRYDVISRYEASGEFATLVLRDGADREWAAARLPAAARRLYRLDEPAIDSVARRALARAFDESALYSERARSVLGPRAPRGRLQLTARRAASRRPAGRTPDRGGVGTD